VKIVVVTKNWAAESPILVRIFSTLAALSLHNANSYHTA